LASDKSPISLINGHRLIELLVANDIGVTRKRLTILELDEAAFSSVAEETPEPEAIKWLIDSFDRVSSEKVARGYWQVPRNFGLTETEGEQLAVTTAGAEYLSDPTSPRLYALAESNVMGFSELLAALREGPRTPAELLVHLNKTLGFAWQTEAQVRFRLGWLENLGLVLAHGDAWQAR
jgi:hypothetical protein